MTHQEYIDKLDELKRKGERAMLSQMPDIEKDILQLLEDYINENIDTKDGKLVANERATKALQEFTDIMTEAVMELKDYKGSVGKYLKNFKDIGTLMEEFHKGNGVNVKAARIGAVQELVTQETINRYSANGLNEGFVQPLREAMFLNISGNFNKKDAMAYLKDFVASGKDTTGKLYRYIEQTAQQAVDSYTGAVNTRIMQTFKINTYIMSGSLISTSSTQCKFAIKKMDGLIDREDWPKLEKIALEEGLIEGTTFDNLPINKLHWGCRHEFTPAVLNEKQRKKLTANKTNSEPVNN